MTQLSIEKFWGLSILLLLVFFSMIFIEIKNSIKNEIAIEGSRANRKYITFFSLFTLIPSILISVFSLFLFSFALEKYFDKKITTAVSNSYQLEKLHLIFLLVFVNLNNFQTFVYFH